MTRSIRPIRMLYVAAMFAAVGAVMLAQGGPAIVAAAAPGGCAPGYQPARERALAQIDSRLCSPVKHPEPYRDVDKLIQQFDAMRYAPLGTVNPHAAREGLRQRAVLATATAKAGIAGANGTWKPYGKGPLIQNDPRYSSVNGEGLNNLSGRVDSLEYDPVDKRLFASIGTGGVWASDDLGDHWRSISDTMPSQITGAIAWSQADGGTLVVVSGEPLNGGDTYTGFGAFRTNDLGKTWTQVQGVPDGALGYQVAVDPTNQNIVYVATSKGLFRSTDAGRTFVNTNLPTHECTGHTDEGRCMFANWVTDVVVQAPDKFGHKGGAVVAALGFRHGPHNFVGTSTPMAPWNGIYRSDSGKPGTFTKLAATGFAPQYRIGRTELGIAQGPDQDHNYLYAIVQDAELLNGGVLPLDSPEALEGLPFNTVLNGVYVSKDLGSTWSVMGDTNTISENPLTGSSLVVAGQATLYAPGVQAWYNEWIKPDPTRTSAGVPTRLGFGLEEVWMNQLTTQPQSGRSLFQVIGRYYSDKTCLLNSVPAPVCPTSRGVIQAGTTHPDQHDAVWVPDGKGGVTLIIGNDGGVYRQHVDANGELDNDHWATDSNEGFHTLMPYQAAMAKDGTVWYGLQDNGSGYIDGKTQKQYETFGGDGFYAATDPNNSKIAYSEYTYGDMRVTTDGGQNWSCMTPPIYDATGSLSGQFANPFTMDPTDANHLMTAGQQVVETTDGPNTHVFEPPVVGPPDPRTCLTTWKQVFDLGSGNQMTTVATRGNASYVGYCGPCNLLNQSEVFARGIATNVGGSAPGAKASTAGWHLAKANGLPNRYVTWIEIDPANPKTIYVTLGGYENRQWVPPGSFGDRNKRIGRGHVFRSDDGGNTFTDISGKLPNLPAFTIVKRGNQLIIGTDDGAFISSDLKGSRWSVLGNGLPVNPMLSLELKPGDPNTLVAATFGRGVYTYTFPAGSPVVPAVKGTKIARKPSGKPLAATGVPSRDFGAMLMLIAAAMLARAVQRMREN